MAQSTIAQIGNGNGLIYETLANGTTILNAWKNNAATRKMLLVKALESHTIFAQNTAETGAYSENFYDPDSNRYFLDSNTGAVATTLSSEKIEITNYLIIPTKNPVLTKTISGGILTVERYAPVTVVKVLPESGTADDLNSIKGPNHTGSMEVDFQEGDIVIIRNHVAANIITQKHASSGEGHLQLSASVDYALKGTSSTPVVAYMKKDESGTKGWEEIFRSGITMQSKKIAVSGSAQTFNPSTDASSKITTLDGEILLDPNGATQNAAFSISTSDPLPGQRYTVRPISNWAGYGASGSVSIFGITLPESLAISGKWKAEIFYDAESTTWRASLIGTTPLSYKYHTVAAGATSYQNNGLKNLAVGDFMYMVAGLWLTFTGSRASGSFNSSTGTISYNGWTPDVDTEGMLIILKTP